MQVDYIFTESDLRAYFDFSIAHDRVAMTHSAEVRRTQWHFIIVLLVLSLALTLETARVLADSGQFLILTAGSAAVLLWASISSLVRAKMFNRSFMIEASIKQHAHSVSWGPESVTISPEGAIHTTRSVTTIRRWSTGVDSIAETTDHIFLICHPRRAIVIPRRAFAASTDAAAFVALARAFFAQAGGPEHARDLIRYLAKYAEPCPACGYNLLAISEPRCPECGREIAGEDIPNFIKFGPLAPPPTDGTSPATSVSSTP